MPVTQLEKCAKQQVGGAAKQEFKGLRRKLHNYKMPTDEPTAP